MTGLIVPAATAAATTATLWFIPILVAAVSFYQYDKTDPEGRPKDTKVSLCLIQLIFLYLNVFINRSRETVRLNLGTRIS